MSRHGAQSDVLRKPPAGLARLALAQRAVDLNRLQPRRRAVDLKEDTHTKALKSRMVFVARQVAEIPLIATFWRPFEIACIGASHRQPAKVDLALIFRRDHRRGEEVPMRGCVGL